MDHLSEKHIRELSNLISERIPGIQVHDNQICFRSMIPIKDHSGRIELHNCLVQIEVAYSDSEFMFTILAPDPENIMLPNWDTQGHFVCSLTKDVDIGDTFEVIALFKTIVGNIRMRRLYSYWSEAVNTEAADWQREYPTACTYWYAKSVASETIHVNESENTSEFETIDTININDLSAENTSQRSASSTIRIIHNPDYRRKTPSQIRIILDQNHQTSDYNSSGDASQTLSVEAQPSHNEGSEEQEYLSPVLEETASQFEHNIEEEHRDSSLQQDADYSEDNYDQLHPADQEVPVSHESSISGIHMVRYDHNKTSVQNPRQKIRIHVPDDGISCNSYDSAQADESEAIEEDSTVDVQRTHSRRSSITSQMGIAGFISNPFVDRHDE